jgi:hypothetical protein
MAFCNFIPPAGISHLAIQASDHYEQYPPDNSFLHPYQYSF